MTSYAVLGATGSTGQSIIKVLLQSPDNKVQAYCRSKTKLLKLLPEVADNKNIQVFEGPLQDVELLASCMRGTKAVFLAVALSDNMPGCTVARDTAHVVIAALERLQDEKVKLPKLVVLSSGSTEPKLMSETPLFVKGMALRAFSHIYYDLAEAEKFLRSKESLVSTTFIKPGVLSQDTQKGHVLSMEQARSPVSFLDLAAGMVEVARSDSGQYDMKSVAVNPTSKEVSFPWQSFSNLPWGLLFHFFPWTYRYLE